MSNHAIHVEHLTRKFGDFTAVNAINFSVETGEVFGFLGPNGSGKTTTIRMLLGLLKPTDGTAHVLGTDIRRATRQFLAQVGYMSQKFSLYSDLTVANNLRFFGRSYGLYGQRLQQRMEFVIELAGLGDFRHTPIHELSGGWLQRLALGAAIIHEPKLIFLDEPTAGVDPVSRRDFWKLLYTLSQSGTTILVTTHYMDEAEHCERVGFIYNGDMIAVGTPSEIITQAVPGQVIEVHPPDALAAQQKLTTAMQSGELSAHGVNLFGAAVHVLTTDVASTQAYLQAAYGSTFQSTPSLEDAFIALVQQADHVNGGSPVPA